MYKVVFHVDELEKWDLVIANANNLINEIKNLDYKVAILANSVAVKKYIDNLYIDKFNSLNKLNIDLIACNNALKGNNITKDMLPEYIRIVPAGVLELTKLQNKDGFAYIRP